MTFHRSQAYVQCSRAAAARQHHLHANTTTPHPPFIIQKCNTRCSHHLPPSLTPHIRLILTPHIRLIFIPHIRLILIPHIRLILICQQVRARPTQAAAGCLGRDSRCSRPREFSRHSVTHTIRSAFEDSPSIVTLSLLPSTLPPADLSSLFLGVSRSCCSI